MVKFSKTLPNFFGQDLCMYFKFNVKIEKLLLQGKQPSIPMNNPGENGRLWMTMMMFMNPEFSSLVARYPDLFGVFRKKSVRCVWRFM